MSLFYLLTLYCSVEAITRHRVLYVGLFSSWLLLIGLLTVDAHGDTVGFGHGVTAYTYALNQTQLSHVVDRLAVEWRRRPTPDPERAREPHASKEVMVTAPLVILIYDRTFDLSSYLGSSLWPHPLLLDYGFADPKISAIKRLNSRMP